MSDKLLCYNKGCGQTFDPLQNNENSCHYHPGLPVFRDVYKKWSCCDKKTTDFTEFLNIKGCAKSYHSNVKPEEPVNKVEKVLNNEEECTKPSLQPLSIIEQKQRPNSDAPLKRLKFTISSSLKPLLEKIKQVVINDSNIGAVEIGTQCKNAGCRAVYNGEQSDLETCIYHAGIPIFHEGLKYWTCCVKRTTDFDSFLEQVGCTTGDHLWHKPKNPENNINCRYDWHQTGSTVVISIYAKCTIPDLSYVEANSVKLNINIVFGSERSIFCTEIPLYEVIDVDGSSITYMGSKVEVSLKKSEPVSWKYLSLNEIRNDIKSP